MKKRNKIALALAGLIGIAALAFLPTFYTGNFIATGIPVFNVKAYGCRADGSLDNSACMQAAINAAVAATSLSAGNTQTATVLCPDEPGPGSTYYYIAKPLVLHGGNVRFVGNGRGSCLLTAFFRGPMFAVGPSGASAFKDAASNIAVASPTPFATNVKSFHIDTTDGNGPYWFSLSDSSALSGLNGLTTFSVDFWMYLTAWPNNAALLCSEAYTDNDSTGSVPLCIYQIGFGNMEVRVRINGGDQRATTVLPTLNAWHHIAVTYDGTTLRAFSDGVLGGTTYGGGGALQIPRRTWIVTNCAPGPSFDNGCSGGTSPTGYISALRLSNVPRWTANFTPPARVNPVADANTLLLCNFDNQYDIFTGCTEGGSSTISWLPIHRQVNATVGNVEVSNVSFNGKGTADGMWIYGATDSCFDNLEMTQVRRGMVFHSDTLTYQNCSHGVEILTNGPASGYDTFGILGVGAANGITTFSKPHVIAAAFPFYWETGSVKFDQPESTPNAVTVTNFYFDGSATSQTTVTLNSPQVDNEAGITNYVSDLTLRSVGSFTSIGGTFGGFANAVPLFNIVGASGGAYTFINPTFIQANTAPSIFHIINNPAQPITIVNPTLLGGITAVPFVDAVNQAIVLNNPGSGTDLAYAINKDGMVALNGSSSIAVSPSTVGTNNGWKLGLWGNSFGVGIGQFTMSAMVGSSGWFSVFDSGSLPANDGTGATPDTHAKISLGSGDGSVRASKAIISGQITSTLSSGTAPLVITSTTPVANLTTVPATYNAAGTQQTATHIVNGAVTTSGAGTATVTLSGAAVFTSGATYNCTVSDNTGSAVVAKVVAYDSGSQFRVAGANTTGISFICVGN